MKPRFLFASVAAFLISVCASGALYADHIVDGSFGTDEWGAGNPTDGDFNFPVVGKAGGSHLYVNNVGTDYYFMVDYWNGDNVSEQSGDAPITFFDAYVKPSTGTKSYALHVTTSDFTLYSTESTVVLNPDGSINYGGWTVESSLGVEAIFGTGTSPDDPVTSHPILEFKLSESIVGTSLGNAFYAAAGGPGVDPPISSAIFQLDPAGGPVTTVIPSGQLPGGGTFAPGVVPLPPAVFGGLALMGAMALSKRMRRRRI